MECTQAPVRQRHLDEVKRLLLLADHPLGPGLALLVHHYPELAKLRQSRGEGADPGLVLIAAADDEVHRGVDASGDLRDRAGGGGAHPIPPVTDI